MINWEKKHRPCCGSFYLQFCKTMLCWGEIRWLTWPLRNMAFLCLLKLLVWYCSMHCFTIHLHCQPLSNQFCSILLNVLLLLLSAVTSSVSTTDPVALTAIHTHAIILPPSWFTDNVICFGSWALSLLLHTFFPHNCFFQKCVGPFKCFLVKSNLTFLFLSITTGLL